MRYPDGGLSGRQRVFLAGQAVSLLGDGLAFLAVPLLVLDLSRSPLISAISAASVTIGYLLVGLPSGALIDRFDPLRVLMAMDAARMLLFTALFVFGQAGLLRVWLILSAGILAGACSVFFETALVVAVRDLFPLSALMGANSAIELASQVSFVLGPAAVGVLAATVGLPLALLIDALTFAVSLLSLACVWSRSPRAAARRPVPGLAALRHDIREGFRYLLSVRLLVTLTVMQMAVNLCLSVEKLIFFYARDTLRLSPFPVSIIVAAGGAGGILGALTAVPLARRAGQIRLIAAAIGACGIAVAAMSAATSFAGLLLANLAYLWALVVAGLLNRTQRQQMIPRELLGRVTSTVRLLFLAVEPLGVLIAGTLTAALDNDPRLVFLGSGTLVTITAVTGWFLGLRTRITPTPPGDERSRNGTRRAAISNVKEAWSCTAGVRLRQAGNGRPRRSG